MRAADFGYVVMSYGTFEDLVAMNMKNEFLDTDDEDIACWYDWNEDDTVGVIGDSFYWAGISYHRYKSNYKKHEFIRGCLS